MFCSSRLMFLAKKYQDFISSKVLKKDFFDVIVVIVNKRNGESLNKTLKINLKENPGISAFIECFYEMNSYVFTFPYLNDLAFKVIKNRLDVTRQLSATGVKETAITKNGIVYNAGFKLLLHRIGAKKRYVTTLVLIGAAIPTKNVREAIESYKKGLKYLEYSKAISILEEILSSSEFDYIFVDADILFELKEVDLMTKIELKFDMLLSYPQMDQKEADIILKNLEKKDNIFYYSDYFEKDKETDFAVYNFLSCLIAEALLEGMPLPPFSWVEPLKWLSEESLPEKWLQDLKMNINMSSEEWVLEFRAGIIKLQNNKIAMNNEMSMTVSERYKKSASLPKYRYHTPFIYIVQRFIEAYNKEVQLLENRIINIIDDKQGDKFYRDHSKFNVSMYYDKISMQLAHFSGQSDFISIKISNLYRMSGLKSIDRLLLIFFPEENIRKMLFMAILRVLFESITFYFGIMESERNTGL